MGLRTGLGFSTHRVENGVENRVENGGMWVLDAKGVENGIENTQFFLKGG